MGLRLKNHVAPCAVTFPDAYAHVSQLFLKPDESRATIHVAVHATREAHDAGASPVSIMAIDVTPEGRASHPGSPALVEEGTGRIVQAAVLERAASPGYADVFGKKAKTQDAFTAAYEFVKGNVPEFAGAEDVLEE